MASPYALAELAELARIPVSDLERYRDAGLLDPDRDGVLDDFDVLRLRLVLHYLDLGWDLDELAKAVIERADEILYADLLFGVTQGYSIEEAADRLGFGVEELTELRTAVGLAGMPLLDRDLEVLATIRTVLETGVSFDAILDAARVYGDALRRLAEAETTIMRQSIAEQVRRADGGEADRAKRLQSVLELVQSSLDPIVQHVHRQHMLRAAVEDAFALLDMTGETKPSELEATILFADLASFTPLAQVHGDEVAARVLERFDGIVRTIAAEHSGTVVKQIGDAFMLRFDDPLEAVRFAIQLDAAAATEPRFPAVRVGIHAGRVLYRVGDYVGNTVNIASRLASVARANEILVTKAVAEAAIEADVSVDPAGERELRGMEEPIPLWRVPRTGTRATRRQRDPVCGMTVGADAAARLLHGGFEFVFCSQECLERFLERPSRYTQTEPTKTT